jgi:hypothetical protein
MMSDEEYELLGLIGFVVSGLFFLIAGIRSGDVLTICGSVAWMIACAGWAVPLLRARRANLDRLYDVEPGDPLDR